MERYQKIAHLAQQIVFAGFEGRAELMDTGLKELNAILEGWTGRGRIMRAEAFRFGPLGIYLGYRYWLEKDLEDVMLAAPSYALLQLASVIVEYRPDGTIWCQKHRDVGPTPFQVVI